MNSKSVKKSHFHLWIPNIFDFKGGIQVYSAILLEALQRIAPQRKYEAMLLHDRPNANNLDSGKIRWHYSGNIPLKLRYFAYTAKLVAWALIQQPKLIIATHLNFTIVAYWLKKLVGIPYWTVAHGIEAWDINRPQLIDALHHADMILAVSQYTRQRLLVEQNLSPEKVTVLPNTFDETRFKIAPKPQYLLNKYGLKPEQPVILTVARLAEAQRHKGYDQILQALPSIRKIIPNVHYVVVGKGKDRSRLEDLIDKLELQDCVTLAGFIPDEQLCDYYNLCDLYAMPSKKEGFGIVYLEAMACGKPALGGNQDGAVDALYQGELGVLVDPDNISEITDNIIAILQKNHSHPMIYQSKKLREQVIQHFGFEMFQQNLSNILQKSLLEVN